MIIRMAKIKDINKLFGHNLVRIIEKEGLSQNKLAGLLSVTPPYINDICQGKTYVSKKTLQKLCDVLNTEPYEFYIQDETPVVINSTEMKVLDNMRKYPESKEVLLKVSEAFADTRKEKEVEGESRESLEEKKKRHKHTA